MAFNQLLVVQFHVPIVQSVSRKVHPLFQTPFPTQRDLVLPFIFLYQQFHSKCSYTTNTANAFKKRRESCLNVGGISPTLLRVCSMAFQIKERQKADTIRECRANEAVWT
jgi:hypothetical protein